MLNSIQRLSDVLETRPETLWKIAKKAGRYYSPIDMLNSNKSNSKWRHLDRPQGELKVIQEKIHEKILSSFPFPEMMFGGIPRRSIRDNAGVHVKQPKIVTIDLKDCFPNVQPDQVRNALASKLHCSDDVVNLLTKLTTFQYRLPQGAPTSPLIANLTLLPLYDDISKISKDLGLRFSFFMDDITISGIRASEAIKPIIDAIHRHEHAVSGKKIKIFSSREEQLVTGAAVNRRVSISDKRRETIQEHILELTASGILTYRDDCRIKGWISFARFLSPEDGAKLQQFAELHVNECYIIKQDSDATESKHIQTRRCSSFAAHRRPKKQSQKRLNV